MVVERLLPTIALFTSSFRECNIFVADKKYKYVTRKKISETIDQSHNFHDFVGTRVKFSVFVLATGELRMLRTASLKESNKNRNRKESSSVWTQLEILVGY